MCGRCSTTRAASRWRLPVKRRRAARSRRTSSRPARRRRCRGSGTACRTWPSSAEGSIGRRWPCGGCRRAPPQGDAEPSDGPVESSSWSASSASMSSRSHGAGRGGPGGCRRRGRRPSRVRTSRWWAPVTATMASWIGQAHSAAAESPARRGRVGPVVGVAPELGEVELGLFVVAPDGVAVPTVESERVAGVHRPGVLLMGVARCSLDPRYGGIDPSTTLVEGAGSANDCSNDRWVGLWEFAGDMVAPALWFWARAACGPVRYFGTGLCCPQLWWSCGVGSDGSRKGSGSLATVGDLFEGQGSPS